MDLHREWAGNCNVFAPPIRRHTDRTNAAGWETQNMLSIVIVLLLQGGD